MPDEPRPITQLRRLVEQVDHAIDEVALALERGDVVDAVEAPFRAWQEGYAWLPVDVLERPDELVVTADLPGYTAADVDVRLTDQVLTIDAERADTVEPVRDGHYLHRERRHKGISRPIRLPIAVRDDEIDVEMANGVLTVRLPLEYPTAVEPIRIDIDDR